MVAIDFLHLVQIGMYVCVCVCMRNIFMQAHTDTVTFTRMCTVIYTRVCIRMIQYIRRRKKLVLIRGHAFLQRKCVCVCMEWAHAHTLPYTQAGDALYDVL